MLQRTFLLAAALCLVLTRPFIVPSSASESAGRLPRIQVNDNRKAAGAVRDGALVLTLRAAAGLWRPEGHGGPALEIEAFGEAAGALQIPAPLIRIAEGTDVVATVQNDLDRPLRVHGLCSRDGTPCPPVEVQPGQHRELRFTSGRPGTYHYWATTMGMPLPFRAVGDTQLSGAFVVDPAGSTPAGDRVLVITDWTSLTRQQLLEIASADDPGAAFFGFEPRFAFMVNGLSWPSTERLGYRVGDEVRWRVVNLSSQAHPMHLHGFYFTVDSLGDGTRDQLFATDQRRRVVTQVLNAGATMAMTWRPEREGNWIFHCHMSGHISPERRLSDRHEADAGHAHHGSHGGTAGAGMAGLVLGVSVRPGLDRPVPSPRPADERARKLALIMTTAPGRNGSHPTYGFALTDGGDAPAATPSVPGPTLVLERGAPVEIALRNQLAEATAIHWHGMELDSYYDGVHGWSGTGAHVTPMIQPGESFTVRFAPPRTGTFIYHTHVHDDAQLAGGMYGAMLVVDPGARFDPATDHVLVIGRDGPGRSAPVLLNGSRQPQFVWKAGTRHRLRFINITPDDILVASLSTADAPAEWRPVAKDGAPLPATEGTARPASQTIAVGETFDFEFDAPQGRRGLWINLRTPGGKWAVQGRVVIKAVDP